MLDVALIGAGFAGAGMAARLKESRGEFDCEVQERLKGSAWARECTALAGVRLR